MRQILIRLFHFSKLIVIHCNTRTYFYCEMLYFKKKKQKTKTKKKQKKKKKKKKQNKKKNVIVPSLKIQKDVLLHLSLYQDCYLSKTSQIIFYLHPGFSHMEDEKGNKLHLFKKYFKIMFFFYYTSHHWSLLLFILIAFCVAKAFAKKK